MSFNLFLDAFITIHSVFHFICPQVFIWNTMWCWHIALGHRKCVTHPTLSARRDICRKYRMQICNSYGYCIWYFINYVCVMSSKPIVVFVWSNEFRTIINSSTWLAFYFIYIHKIALYVYSGDHSISTPLFVRIYLKQHIIFLTY